MPLMCCSLRPSRAKEIGAVRWFAGAVGVAFVLALAVVAASLPAQAQSPFVPPAPPAPPPTPLPTPPPPPPTPSRTAINSDVSAGAAMTNLGSNFLGGLCVGRTPPKRGRLY